MYTEYVINPPLAYHNLNTLNISVCTISPQNRDLSHLIKKHSY